MKKALLIAEKPSLMNEIQECYKRHKDEIPYDITFTAQRGHLVTLKTPDELDETLKKWSFDTLPIVPEDHGGWQYKVIEEKKVGNYLTSKERYNNIKKEIRSGKYDFIINAGDPDQEGELLIQLVLRHIGNKLPVKRFWSNDLTDPHVLKALQELRDNDTDPMLKNLLNAAYARQHSDYRFGMNLSRAVTLKMNIRVAVGRVKTVLLKLVCKREEEIKNFTPKTVYGVKAVYQEGFEGTLINEMTEPETEEETDEKEQKGVIWFDTKREAEEMIASLGRAATVTTYETKQVESYAPKLLKLATAQQAAGEIGYGAEETQKIIQSLYEKKLLSYPRTDCEYISSDEDLYGLLRAAMAAPELTPFIKTITKGAIERVKKSKTWVNDKALQESGHSALIPTGNAPAWDSLSKEEQDIYTLVCRRFVAPFLPPLVQDQVKLLTDIDGSTFRTTGKTLVDPGYTKIFGKNFVDTEIPRCEQGSVLHVQEFGVNEKTSVCPKRYTTPELIAVCENPAKHLEDKELKKLGKRLKIGTPATRAGIIDELVTRDKYLEKRKEGKRTVVAPTPTGILIIENIKWCDICRVDMTGEWEEKLELVRSGLLDLSSLELAMKEQVERLVDEIKAREMKQGEKSASEANGSAGSGAPVARGDFKSKYPCPCCKRSMTENAYKVTCTCGFTAWKKVGNTFIPEEELDALFLGPKHGTGYMKFKKKDGGTFTAKIVFDLPKRSTKFEFKKRTKHH